MVHTSDKSAVEIDMEKMCIESEEIIDDSYLTRREARKLVDLLAKGLIKVKELRQSRDNWRNKFEKAKETPEGFHHLVEDVIPMEDTFGTANAESTSLEDEE